MRKLFFILMTVILIVGIFFAQSYRINPLLNKKLDYYSANTDVTVAIDSAATAGYLGAASSDGVLRTSSPLVYTDGGDFVTLSLTTIGNTIGGTGQDSSGWTGVVYASAGTWASEAQLANSRGGTGQDSSGWTGYAYITAGAWAQDTVLTQITNGVQITGSGPGIIDLNDGTYETTLRTTQYEGLAGGDFRIGLDKTANIFIICESEDINTDFGLASESNPNLIFVDSTATYYTKIRQGGGALQFVGTNGNNHAFEFSGKEKLIYETSRDVDNGNAITFNSGIGDELTEDDSQAWFYIEGKVNKTTDDDGDAPYQMLKIRVTETDIDTGTLANYLIDAGLTSTLFAVDRLGAIKTTISTLNCSNPPTDAELDAEFGTPATVGSGWQVFIDDNGDGANFYLAVSDGTNWWLFTGTVAS